MTIIGSILRAAIVLMSLYTMGYAVGVLSLI
jgi:hypothetical protein